jgi:hypothetical protein
MCDSNSNTGYIWEGGGAHAPSAVLLSPNQWKLKVFDIH